MNNQKQIQAEEIYYLKEKLERLKKLNELDDKNKLKIVYMHLKSLYDIAKLTEILNEKTIDLIINAIGYGFDLGATMNSALLTQEKLDQLTELNQVTKEKLDLQEQVEKLIKKETSESISQYIR